MMTRVEQTLPVNKSPLSSIVPALGGTFLAGLLAWGFLTGRNLCVELALEDEEPRYSRCLNGLADIRRKQKERWDAAIQ
jgi:hypothetical protein